MEYFLLLDDSGENCYLIDKSRVGSNRLAIRVASLERRHKRGAACRKLHFNFRLTWLTDHHRRHLVGHLQS